MNTPTNTNQQTDKDKWRQKRAAEELENRIEVLEFRLKKLGYFVRREKDTLIVENNGKNLTASFNTDRIEEALIIGGDEVRVDREKVLAGHTRHIRNELGSPQKEPKKIPPEQQKQREQKLKTTVSEIERDEPENSLSMS